MYLVVVDTAQIQPYIFGSNRLRENIGASYLVAQATEAWAIEAVRAVTAANNISADGTLDITKRIEDTSASLDAEVLYAGGGNFVVLFRDLNGAGVFTRMLSRRALTDAPNLQLVISQLPFDWSDSLYEKVKAIFKILAEEKRARRLSTPLLGSGVTVMCQSTGLPAQQIVKPIPTDPTSVYPASAEIVAKLEATNAANEGLLRTFQATVGNDYIFPRDFDELGRTSGEHSYIAVVHADGDGIGQRIMDVGKKYRTTDKNRSYINAIRSFSRGVEEGAQAALNTSLATFVARLRQGGGSYIVHKNAIGKALAKIELRSAGTGRHYLSFRPIVFGGDDVTFVCDGRLGLSLATAYLESFENETAHRPECLGKITACAGIAIVKAHYPFARAYALADELCRSAKNYRRREDIEGSCLDWHFGLSGLSGTIEDIREREYRVKTGWLTLRPVTLAPNVKKAQHSWGAVRKGIEAFQDLPPSTKPGEQPKWSTRRNKVKALRDSLRGGSESVRHFLTKFNEGRPLPIVEPSMANWPTEGWQADYCGYFDAIELADWFIPL